MQLGLEPEPLRSEPRFHPETVQKAVALAQRLEQERHETLSLDQVNQLAEELSLDPQVLRMALARVSAEEAQQTSVQAQAPLAVRRNQGPLPWLLLMFTLGLAFLLLVGGYFAVSVAPAPPLTPPTPVQVGMPEVIPITPPTAAATAPLPPSDARPHVEGR